MLGGHGWRLQGATVQALVQVVGRLVGGQGCSKSEPGDEPAPAPAVPTEASTLKAQAHMAEETAHLHHTPAMEAGSPGGDAPQHTSSSDTAACWVVIDADDSQLPPPLLLPSPPTPPSTVMVKVTLEVCCWL